jgi:hypothetical protein
VEELMEILQKSQGRVFVHCGTGQRACSLSLAASGVGADSIQRARELGFPVEDAKTKVIFRWSKEIDFVFLIRAAFGFNQSVGLSLSLTPLPVGESTPTLLWAALQRWNLPVDGRDFSD